MTTTTNRNKSLRFRELVALVLQAEGLPAVKKIEPKLLSEAIRDERERGGIQGISGWLINSRNEVTRDLSGGLDEAQKDAEHDGKAKCAVVWRRHGRPAGESYVVMPLTTFAAVLRDEMEQAK